MTAMPISTGLPRQSLIFCLLLLRVMIFRLIFMPVVTAAEDLTSPLWFSMVFAAGLTAVQKGLTQ